MSILQIAPLRLSSEAERQDSLLFAGFLAASRSSTLAVIGVNERLMVTNGRASSFLDSKDHAGLWESVLAQVREVSCAPVIFTVPGRGGVPARCTAVADGARIAGVVVTLDTTPVSRLRLVDGEEPSRVFPGRSDLAVRVQRQFGDLVPGRDFILVTGEAGTGKSFVARQLLMAGDGSARTAAVDARDCADESWVDHVASVLHEHDRVVLRHLDELDPERGAALAAVLADNASHARVVATAITTIASCHLLDGMFPGRLHLPPLREHLEDIPAVAAQLLDAEGSARSRYRLSVEARRALWAHDWLGNVEELRLVLARAIERSPSTIIDGFSVQLPNATHAVGGARPGMLRQEERQILLDVLAKAHNNKLIAADMLGIARSTLYRKLDALGIANH